LEFTDVALTSYAGLELFGRYLRTTRFNAVVREAGAGAPAWGFPSLTGSPFCDPETDPPPFRETPSRHEIQLS
jgi:hypothetical protein